MTLVHKLRSSATERTVIHNWISVTWPYACVFIGLMKTDAFPLIILCCRVIWSVLTNGGEDIFIDYISILRNSVISTVKFPLRSSHISSSSAIWPLFIVTKLETKHCWKPSLIWQLSVRVTFALVVYVMVVDKNNVLFLVLCSDSVPVSLPFCLVLNLGWIVIGSNFVFESGVVIFAHILNTNNAVISTVPFFKVHF